jgi:glycosyltransferase involved in cell wall biosynthesis
MSFNELIASLSTATWIASGVFILSFTVQAIYYLFIFRIGSANRNKKGKEGDLPVSVIICARNEADNLAKHLPLFLSQDYTAYEVVVVNDCSSDHTDEVLMDLKEQYDHLKVTTISQDRKFTHGKKLAVTVGIKAATNEHLLFSDADCYPLSDRWIRLMSRNFSNKTELILGVGRYEKKRGLLNTVIRYETLFTAMHYVSSALKGKPFMGVGRNLAYTKELFFRNKGFASHLKLQSGDDDLFVKEAANDKNTAVETDPESHTLSIPPSGFRAWLRQKRRHITTGKYYRASSKFRLGLEYFTRVLFYASWIFLMLDGTLFWISLAGYAILTLLKLVRVKLVMRHLNEKDLLLPSLLIEPLLPLVLGILRAVNLFRPRELKWK